MIQIFTVQYNKNIEPHRMQVQILKPLPKQHMAHSLMILENEFSLSPSKRPWSPLGPICRENSQKNKTFLFTKLKHHRSSQNIPTLNSSATLTYNNPEKSKLSFSGNTECSLYQNGHNYQAKNFLKGQKRIEEKAQIIPNLFKKSQKLPTFLKAHKLSNPSIQKQVEVNTLPKSSLKFLSDSKSAQKAFLKSPRSKQYKTFCFNNKRETFEIIKYVDKGSSGNVHLVRHITTNTIYCLKSISKSSLDEQNLNQLIRQCQIQSFLSHPNIINLYSFTSDLQFVYLLLQASPGQNLYKKLNQKKIGEKDVKKYIKDICSAVEYMHRHNVIHRDIKPENILLHENTVKICDFGWAVHSPLLRNTHCGTPLYNPPQIIKSESYDSKIDIWCIGVLTYELLYGTIPFEVRHPNDLSKIVSDSVYFSKESSISSQAKHFIQRCLEKNPSERYSIQQALEDEFLAGKGSENF